MLRVEVSWKMATKDILEKFKECFPCWADDIIMYKQNKDGSIKVELKGKRFYVFTYKDDRTMRCETVRSYEKSLE